MGLRGHFEWDLPVTFSGIDRSLWMGLRGHFQWD